jgi:hypothetical protein
MQLRSVALTHRHMVTYVKLNVAGAVRMQLRSVVWTHRHMDT